LLRRLQRAGDTRKAPAALGGDDTIGSADNQQIPVGTSKEGTGAVGVSWGLTFSAGLFNFNVPRRS
jgi:hypothetical protein